MSPYWLLAFVSRDMETSASFHWKTSYSVYRNTVHILVLLVSVLVWIFLSLGYFCTDTKVPPCDCVPEMAVPGVPPAQVHFLGDFFALNQLTRGPVLGSGMCGEVVLATSSTGAIRQLAVKMLPVRTADQGRRSIRLFIKEATTLQKLSHPHVVQYILAASCPDYLIISTMYYPNGTLTSKLGNLTMDLATKYFVQMACAVRYLNDHIGIVHYDIKPDNIFINAQDDAVLGDFGLSLEIPADGTYLSTSDMGGTVGFHAPEKFNRSYADPLKVDVYSLGVVLWCIVFNTIPTSDNAYNCLNDTQLMCTVPQPLRWCMSCTLTYCPFKRFSASALLKMLHSDGVYSNLIDRLMQSGATDEIMFTCRSIALKLLCSMAITGILGSDCPYEVCTCYETQIDCYDQGLTSIPELDSVRQTSYHTLFLNSNDITDIPAGCLLPGLTQLQMDDNPVTTIDNQAFVNVSTTLQSLSFTGARFSRIPDAFLHLNALQDLGITDTAIVDWNDAVMSHLGKTLETLELVNVGLNSWPVWLQNCSRLSELSITINNISSIPDKALDTLATSLVTLSLNNNNFIAVPKALSVLNNLNSLDLHGNKISKITWLPQSARLSQLMLNNNDISDAVHLSNSLRSFADSLVSLSLSYNRLTAIPDLSFMTRVTSLDFSYNQISNAYSGSVPRVIDEVNFSYNLLPHIPVIYRHLTSIIYFNLPHNSILEIQEVDIPTWITDLDLDHNLITELTDTSFPVNCSLLGITLDNVPLVKISKLAFKNLVSLVSLSLVNTALTRLPLSLTFLTNLRYLDLSNNSGLICTCLEKSLQSVFSSTYELSGTCGLISIQRFFTQLSPQCP